MLLSGTVYPADWTAQVVPEATTDHLDPAAIGAARMTFYRKNARRFRLEEIAEWSNPAFLNRIGLTMEGRVTRAALLLLGRVESASLLSPHPAQLTWKLAGPEGACEHFGPPFLLSTNRLYHKIRNVPWPLLPEDLIEDPQVTYAPRVVLETLHNGIAHQDYTRNARVVVTEHPDRLVLGNAGSFFAGAPADYFGARKPPGRCRNPFLVRAMMELDMAGTPNSGIHGVFAEESARCVPLPDYDLRDPDAVTLTLHGRIFDSPYSRLLIRKRDLPMEDIVALDRMQKKLPIDEDTLSRLKRGNWIGESTFERDISPTPMPSASARVGYIRSCARDRASDKQKVMDYLEKFGSASREEIRKLFRDKESEVPLDPPKEKKINHLLTNLRRTGWMKNIGSRKAPKWLAVPPEKRRINAEKRRSRSQNKTQNKRRKGSAAPLGKGRPD